MEIKEFIPIEKIGFLSLLIIELKHSFVPNQGACISNTLNKYIGLSLLCYIKFPELDDLINSKCKERDSNFGWNNNKDRIKDLEELQIKLIKEN